MIRSSVVAIVLAAFIGGNAMAQDYIPADNGLATYHTEPRYRQSESHPLRVISYIFHPVGWVLREAIFRPLSYFASSTETTRSVMGFREPFDYRQPECFSSDDSAPDCRSLRPYNYDAEAQAEEDQPEAAAVIAKSEMLFPDINFDFDKRKLSDLGKGRVRQLADLLSQHAGVKVVLEGNADYVGNDKYNEKLGMDRTDAVRNELLALGVSADRLSSVTFGEGNPLYADQEPWARAVNRRVTVRAEQ